MPINNLKFVSSLLMLTVSACQSNDSKAAIAQEATTVKSWAATAQMLGEAWVQGSVPQVYAKQVLQKTTQELDKEAKTIQKEFADQPQLPQQVQQVQQAVQQMSQAIEQQNPAAIAQPLHQLAATQQQLDRLSQSAAPEGQP